MSEVQDLLASITSENNCLTPTLLYNEGWLVKLVIRAAAGGIDCLTFSFEPQSRWFSEALLHSAFPGSEGTTHADCVIGHFSFGHQTKAGTLLESTCSQLVVCEAKMSSGLSSGTSRARDFDQAARSVASMAKALSRCKLPVDSYRSLGFYVLAPASQIHRGVFSEHMTKVGIKRKLTDRAAMHRDEAHYEELAQWLQDWALPLVDKMDLACFSWEDAIKRISAADASYGASLAEFYALCLRYN